MTPKAIRVLAWLVTGDAVCAALYWGLLNVPESNVLMLAVSALLTILVAWTAAGVNATAAAWLAPDATFGTARRTGAGALAAFLLALVAFGAAAWAGARLDAWHDAVHGEIDAWLIATFRTTHSAWLHRGLDLVVFVLQYALGPSMAAGVLAVYGRSGLGAAAASGWARVGLAPRQVALTVLAIGIFVVLPMRLVYWRPASLPPSWIQPAFATVKLAVVALLVHVGWMIVLAGAALRAEPVVAAPTIDHSEAGTA